MFGMAQVFVYSTHWADSNERQIQQLATEGTVKSAPQNEQLATAFKTNKSKNIRVRRIAANCSKGTVIAVRLLGLGGWFPKQRSRGPVVLWTLWSPFNESLQQAT